MRVISLSGQVEGRGHDRPAGEVMTKLIVPVQQRFPRRGDDAFGPAAIKMDEVGLIILTVLTVRV